jgi:hypothetical protein
MKPFEKLYHHEYVKRGKILRMVLFSVSDIPIATCVFDGNKVFLKTMTSSSITLYNSEPLEFRWIKHEVYKLGYFRIYPIMNTEIDDNYLWQGKMTTTHQWGSGRGIKSTRLLFDSLALKMEWN